MGGSGVECITRICVAHSERSGMMRLMSASEVRAPQMTMWRLSPVASSTAPNPPACTPRAIAAASSSRLAKSPPNSIPLALVPRARPDLAATALWEPATEAECGVAAEMANEPPGGTPATGRATLTTPAATPRSRRRDVDDDDVAAPPPNTRRRRDEPVPCPTGPGAAAVMIGASGSVVGADSPAGDRSGGGRVMPARPWGSVGDAALGASSLFGRAPTPDDNLAAAAAAFAATDAVAAKAAAAAESVTLPTLLRLARSAASPAVQLPRGSYGCSIELRRK